MDALNVMPGEELFTHTCPKGVKRTFNTTAIMRDIARGRLVPELFTIEIPEEVARHCLENHGVEETQLARMTDERLKTPILIAVFDQDQTQLIIDGSHRVVYSYRKGIHSLPGFVLPEGLWKSYLVTGFGVTRTLEEALKVIEL